MTRRHRTGLSIAILFFAALDAWNLLAGRMLHVAAGSAFLVLLAFLLIYGPSRKTGMMHRQAFRPLIPGQGRLRVELTIDGLRASGKRRIIDALGVFNDEPAGIRIGFSDVFFEKSFFPDPGLNHIPDSDAFLAGFYLETLGASSDQFLAFLSKSWNIPVQQGFTNKKIHFFCVGTREEPWINYKLAYDPENKEGFYCRLFVRINLPEERVEILESDEAFREKIIQVMSQ